MMRTRIFLLWLWLFFAAIAIPRIGAYRLVHLDLETNEKEKEDTTTTVNARKPATLKNYSNSKKYHNLCQCEGPGQRGIGGVTKDGVRIIACNGNDNNKPHAAVTRNHIGNIFVREDDHGDGNGRRHLGSKSSKSGKGKGGSSKSGKSMVSQYLA